MYDYDREVQVWGTKVDAEVVYIFWKKVDMTSSKSGDLSLHSEKLFEVLRKMFGTKVDSLNVMKMYRSFYGSSRSTVYKHVWLPGL